VYRLRTHPSYRFFFATLTEQVFPFVFGWGCLAAVGLVLLGSANRMVFAAASAAGSTCIDAPARPWDGAPTKVMLPSNELCQQTGLQLQKGQRYRVEIVLPDNATVPKTEQWRDKSIHVDTPAGFSSGRGPLFMMFLPFRRVLTAQWFVPMVRVGDHLAEYHRIDQLEEIPAVAGVPARRGEKRRVRGFVEFTPSFTGQMFLFVNDALLPGPWLKTLYANNNGTAQVTVSAIEPDPAEAGASR